MSRERRFHCTACGKCCRGWLPLTVAEAFAHAGRFPLAMIWTPVRAGAKSHGLAQKLGVSVSLPGSKKEAGVFITPTVYLPADMPCPALAADGLLCTIHDDKPLRCRAMPFYAYREADDQADMLIPRQGWECDVTSTEAQLVYRDKTIQQPDDFSAERQALADQVGQIRAYAKHVLTYVPGVPQHLAHAASGKFAGHMVMSLYLFLSRFKNDIAVPVARAQREVLQRLADVTADQPRNKEYHANYQRWLGELARFG